MSADWKDVDESVVESSTDELIEDAVSAVDSKLTRCESCGEFLATAATGSSHVCSE